MKKTVVKIKQICKWYFNNNYETKDKRYNVNCNIQKIIKKCFKYGFPFKVGFVHNTLCRNMNYIEITAEVFSFPPTKLKYDELDELERFLKKKELKK